MTLRELQVGDRFRHEAKRGKFYQVTAEKCSFNLGHGSSTRLCWCEHTKKWVSKSCNLKVVKL